MTNSILKGLFLLSVSLCSLFAEAQVSVKTQLDTANILIGEQVQLQLKCTASANQKVEFPNFQAQDQLTPGVEVISNNRIDTIKINHGRQFELTRRYTITSFDSALYSIPPMKVVVDGKEYLSQNPLGLKVSTVPVDTVHVDQFNPPHGVLNIQFEWSWRFISMALIVWIIACITIILIIRYSDPRLITRRIVVHPPIPAHITAIQEIESIKSNPKEDTKQYYMHLTDTLREYIEKRFNFNAKEMTTSEIIDELYTIENTEALEELKSILLTADLVKFAQHSVSMSEQDRNLIQALEFVDTTKVEPTEPPKPKIEYVSYSGNNQHKIRMMMMCLIIILSIVTIGLLSYIGLNIYQCFA